MTKNKLKCCLLIVMLAAMLLGCKSSSKPTAKPAGPGSPLGAPVTDSPLPPAAADTVVQALPQMTQVPLVLPTPAPGKAVVSGVLLRSIPGVPLEAMAKYRLYLGPVITTASGGGMVSHDPNRDALTFTNDDGSFIFAGIEPGEYGLIVVTPLSSIMMKYHDTGKEVVFTIQAGEMLDLGELHFVSPF